MKRKACVVVLIAAGLFVVMPNSAFAILTDSSFMGDYLGDNWQPKIVFNLPNEAFGIFPYTSDVLEDLEFVAEKPSINVLNQTVFHNDEIPLCFEYQGTGDNPFVSGDSIMLGSGTARTTDYQFALTLDSLFSQFLLGERIDFPAHSFYERRGGIAYSAGSASLAGISGSTTLAALGMGMVFVFFSFLGGVEIVDFLRK